MEVGKAVAGAERAIDRADEAWEKAHKTASFVQGMETTMVDHARRLKVVESEQDEQKSAPALLAESVNRLAAKLPPPKSATEITREVWESTSRRAKIGIVGGLIALFSMPEVLKELGAALGRLISRIG
jgi:hypothetical protein